MGTISQQCRPNGRRPVPLSQHGREHANAPGQAQAYETQGRKNHEKRTGYAGSQVGGKRSDDDDVAAGQQRAFGRNEDAIPQTDSAFNAIEPEAPGHDDPQHQDHHQ
jgi:hypothetical protein